jgi:nucleoid-associated protein YgaU
VVAIFAESTLASPEPVRLYVVERPSRTAPARPSPAVYRRRRLAAALLAALLVVVAWSAATRVAALGGVPASAPERSPAVPAAASAEVLVRPGDTLWSIARRVQPEGDIRPLVRQLLAVNGGSALQPGDVLLVP